MLITLNTGHTTLEDRQLFTEVLYNKNLMQAYYQKETTISKEETEGVYTLTGKIWSTICHQ